MILRSCLLWLLCGAVATCVMAWACVVVGYWRVNATNPKKYTGFFSEPRRELGLMVVGRFDPEQTFTVDDVPPEDADQALDRWIDRKAQSTVIVVSAGWPYRALEGAARYRRVEFTDGPPSEETEYLIRFPGTEVFNFDRMYMNALPLAPHWPAFLADTACWGAFLFVVARGPAFIKRVLTRKQDTCTACGYRLAGLARCPECGAESASLASATAAATALSPSPAASGQSQSPAPQ